MATIMWTNAETYDIFKLVWSMKGLTLSQSDQESTGKRIQRIAIPTSAASNLISKLHALDPSAKVIN